MDQLSDRVAALDSSERQRLLERVRARRAERPRGAEGRGRLRFSLFFFGTGEGREIEDHYRLVFDCARFADENGFEAVWVPERHFDVFGAPYPSPAVLVAALAAATRRLQVRAGSVVVPLHDPVRVAEDWAVVDGISGGRAGLALASGWHANDFVLAPDRFEGRKQALVDDLATIRTLWRGGDITRTDGAGNEVSLRTYPLPRRGELPMWITSSSSEQTWRTGADLGLNVLTGLVEQSVEDVRDRVEMYRESLAAAGREPQAHTVTAMVHTFIGSDLESVREEVRAPLTAYLRAHIGLYEKLVRSADLNLDADKVTDADKDALADIAFTRYFATHGLFGAPEDALEMVHRLVDAGVDEVGCLVDFGLPPSRVLEHLKHLAALKDMADREVPSRTAGPDSGKGAR
ncbi:MupA/Atu3671 family FMN-dependent luciferase-like monooxygenase [Nocardioides zeae]|uniref:Natural product biosynthesis luciferase-like monooxygenase protein n=1 Tax=Nocardioides zeae TaxID=1457234 RepID=A0AAJ1X078_9ACTN|nr:MupA/Atu3671 family FMN-dependent luciferase-like monooxygenase [Nocardioides zeae]MDQ1102844.1 natural product biosynthesis luciferase-like monooxygenase protein [Nocardioides zeae]